MGPTTPHETAFLSIYPAGDCNPVQLTGPVSGTIEALYSSIWRQRQREESAKDKAKGAFQGHLLPKQAFAGSPAQAAGQEIPSPAPQPCFRVDVASQLEAAMQNRHLLRQDVALSVSPIRLAFEDFMLSRQGMRCTPATLEHYRYSAGAFVSWLERQGLPQPEQVQAALVQAWLVEIARGCAKDTTLHAKARGAHALLRFWAREGYIPQLVAFDMPRLSNVRLDGCGPAAFSEFGVIIC